jgi:hypothetical protein
MPINGLGTYNHLQLLAYRLLLMTSALETFQAVVTSHFSASDVPLEWLKETSLEQDEGAVYDYLWVALDSGDEDGWKQTASQKLLGAWKNASYKFCLTACRLHLCYISTHEASRCVYYKFV